MTTAIALQIVLALGIFNVWIVRRDRATAYRPEGAENIQQEFRRYGFPDWMWKVVGAVKVTLATLLLIGIAVPAIVPAAAAALAFLMLWAVVAHIRAGDPALKSVPALLMLLMSSWVIVAYTV